MLTGAPSLAGKADSWAAKLSVEGMQLLGWGGTLWQFTHLHLLIDPLTEGETGVVTALLRSPLWL